MSKETKVKPGPLTWGNDGGGLVGAEKTDENKPNPVVDHGVLLEEPLSPVMAISMAMVTVAEGGSMQPVQSVVNEVMKSMTREQKHNFLTHVRRWRDASEQAYHMVQSQVLGG